MGTIFVFKISQTSLSKIKHKWKQGNSLPNILYNTFRLFNFNVGTILNKHISDISLLKNN